MDAELFSTSKSGPLFILAPNRSFTSVICAMLGQHPQLYGLPEMNFFVTETLLDWWAIFRGGAEIGAHGPLRAVAEIFFGSQNPGTIRQAGLWLRKRLPLTTASIFREIEQKVHPLLLVEKSPSTSYRIEHLERCYRNFSNARFLHLIRHPRGHGESVIKALAEAGKYGALPRGVRDIGFRLRSPNSKSKLAPKNLPGSDGRLLDFSTDPPTIDPQQSWLRIHLNILTFLARVPEEQKLRLRAEDLLSAPEVNLQRIAEWLGIRNDPEAITRMQHPERSPFARFGPHNAPLGNDPGFMLQPALRVYQPKSQNLAGPVPWRPDGAPFTRQVCELAELFGY